MFQCFPYYSAERLPAQPSVGEDTSCKTVRYMLGERKNSSESLNHGNPNLYLLGVNIIEPTQKCQIPNRNKFPN